MWKQSTRKSVVLWASIASHLPSIRAQNLNQIIRLGDINISLTTLISQISSPKYFILEICTLQETYLVRLVMEGRNRHLIKIISLARQTTPSSVKKVRFSELCDMHVYKN